ncbi:dihydroneopterin aldolase [Alteriqipengyuania flavescens]|uniref:dihydroneopterin aldolase n=1 Tax=Alteriqipengyuania flavescens TaxID=3053610 RepID=UPI0025B2EF9A|nr:dihydroneopterin aldolase [Alteriqipengyuania flavescens]WJY18844.1 dihydroneopterin aldolase [Alteriqipengyuania flavescens]WJY24784.1 dihydroneopterin aldolase [Alteriqipengyuania flavescens]
MTAFSKDTLVLEVADFTHDVLTGIYSEETGEAQPLVFTISVRMRPEPEYTPDTPLSDSKNYMDLIEAASSALPKDVHFKLIESVADHVCTTLMAQDERIEAVTVKIVKPKISEADEKIGMTLHRERR